MRKDWDYKNTMDYAIAQGHAQGKEEGIAEGMVKGIAEGLVKGKAEGLAEGKIEGQAEEKQATARRMLAKGMTIETVVEITELSEEQVRALS